VENKKPFPVDWEGFLKYPKKGNNESLKR